MVLTNNLYIHMTEGQIVTVEGDIQDEWYRL